MPIFFLLHTSPFQYPTVEEVADLVKELVLRQVVSVKKAAEVVLDLD